MEKKKNSYSKHQNKQNNQHNNIDWSEGDDEHWLALMCGCSDPNI
jgi:hypothetical protein